MFTLGQRLEQIVLAYRLHLNPLYPSRLRAESLVMPIQSERRFIKWVNNSPSESLYASRWNRSKFGPDGGTRLCNLSKVVYQITCDKADSESHYDWKYHCNKTVV